ncbi:MAG TPA: SusD/RagB family nutrient-binding outer membrane lipoprotein, partial [Draconibacterium sp.]|nr:SusD/RagB family nutrient-binding outer membrane lipoprotein [Draconibacterium sp.]
SQYRQLENIYNALPDAEKADRRIYMIAATIYMYDALQKVVDLHGDVPFTDAGKIIANGGDYKASMPKYDKAEDIYTKMLDDLKVFADELNTMTVSSGILAGFKTQDIVNKGDIAKWKRYCNSLRLRMLTRVSGVSSFQARSASEINSILNNPSAYPIVTSNADNIQIKIHDLNTPINSMGFRTGLEDWGGNYAGKVIIDHMKANSDPRLKVMFQPGTAAEGDYFGLDPLATSGDQDAFILTNKLSLYNWSTMSRNQFFPGVLINASEVHFIAAEGYLNANNDAAAKTAYEAGIANSIKNYYLYRSVSNNNESGSVVAPTDAEIADYIAQSAISWSNAATKQAKLTLIGMQKWIDYSVIQPLDNWAEVRRLNVPQLSFWIDNADPQKQPPTRWFYPDSEKTYNTENYNAVSANDKITNKIFWDVN